jgi:hypothetical protein
MIMNDADFGLAAAKAAEIGTEHGKSAASWVFDGNTSDETYRRVLSMLDDGDPAVFDMYRTPDFSGEFAGDYTETELWSECGLDPEDDDAAEASQEVSSAYLVAAEEAFWDEVERLAREHLSA